MLTIHLEVAYNQLQDLVWIMIIIHYGLLNNHIINLLKLIVSHLLFRITS